jgi:quercetin dioxygenase-like cupin family protein
MRVKVKPQDSPFSALSIELFTLCPYSECSAGVFNTEFIGLKLIDLIYQVWCVALKEENYFIDLASAPTIKQMKGLETTILTGLQGEKMMMVLNTTLPGHTVPTHSHPHEQIGMVHSGKAFLKIGEKERIVKKGDFYSIPPNVPHSDRCIGKKPFVMLDIFYPIRQDFLEKTKRKIRSL